MKKFSTIMESSVNMDELALTDDDIASYFKKYSSKKEVTNDVIAASNLCKQYNINSKSLLTELISASGSALKNLAARVNVTVEELKDLKKMLNKLSKNMSLNYLPQFLGVNTIGLLNQGKVDFDEATLDFDSEPGQTAIVKKYTDVLKGAVAGYKGKSGLTEDDLWSIGWAVMAYCIKTYNKPGKVSLKWALGNEISQTRSDAHHKDIDDADSQMNADKKASFRTYLVNSIHNAFKIEMNENGRNVRINQKAYDGAEEGDTAFGREVSIDQAFGDEDAGSTDHYKAIGQDETFSEMNPDKEQAFKKFIDALTKLYDARNVEWLKKSFGIGTPDGKKMSQAEIAKEAGLSQKAVSKALEKMLRDIMTNPKLKEYKETVRQAFFESLGTDFLNMTRKEIKEALLANDTFLLIVEESNLNTDKELKINYILYNNFCEDDAKWLKEALDGKIAKEEFTFNKNKIRAFLNNYDIFENHNTISEKELFEKFNSICNK